MNGVNEMGSTNVNSVVRAMKIIEYLAKKGPSRISDVARDLDLNKSTAYGLLHTLVGVGFVAQEERTQSYRLSVRINELGRLSLTHIPEQTMIYEAMLGLVQTYGETFHLVSSAGDEVIYINKVESEQSIRVATSIGTQMPMYCTAVGKAILMTRSDEEIEAYCDRITWKAFTDYTITSKKALIADLEESRKRQYAVDDNEVQVGMFCAGVPVVLPGYEAQYALSISMPQFRREQIDRKQLIQDLHRTAQELALILYRQ